MSSLNINSKKRAHDPSSDDSTSPASIKQPRRSSDQSINSSGSRDQSINSSNNHESNPLDLALVYIRRCKDELAEREKKVAAREATFEADTVTLIQLTESCDTLSDKLKASEREVVKQVKVNKSLSAKLEASQIQMATQAQSHLTELDAVSKEAKNLRDMLNAKQRTDATTAKAPSSDQPPVTPVNDRSPPNVNAELSSAESPRVKSEFNSLSHSYSAAIHSFEAAYNASSSSSDNANREPHVKIEHVTPPPRQDRTGVPSAVPYQNVSTSSSAVSKLTRVNGPSVVPSTRSNDNAVIKKQPQKSATAQKSVPNTITDVSRPLTSSASSSAASKSTSRTSTTNGSQQASSTVAKAVRSTENAAMVQRVELQLSCRPIVFNQRVSIGSFEDDDSFERKNTYLENTCPSELWDPVTDAPFKIREKVHFLLNCEWVNGVVVGAANTSEILELMKDDQMDLGVPPMGGLLFSLDAFNCPTQLPSHHQICYSVAKRTNKTCYWYVEPLVRRGWLSHDCARETAKNVEALGAVDTSKIV